MPCTFAGSPQPPPSCGIPGRVRSSSGTCCCSRLLPWYCRSPPCWSRRLSPCTPCPSSSSVTLGRATRTPSCTVGMARPPRASRASSTSCSRRRYSRASLRAGAAVPCHADLERCCSAEVMSGWSASCGSWARASAGSVLRFAAWRCRSPRVATTWRRAASTTRSPRRSPVRAPSFGVLARPAPWTSSAEAMPRRPMATRPHRRLRHRRRWGSSCFRPSARYRRWATSRRCSP
mmetsp:Transcript_36740/g.105843  ORF Transcript_36740/g.105843 Transcript_36740/m.105843 type:complete len:233 (-) Transcript_36740:641-1339(-)